MRFPERVTQFLHLGNANSGTDVLLPVTLRPGIEGTIGNDPFINIGGSQGRKRRSYLVGLHAFRSSPQELSERDWAMADEDRAINYVVDNFCTNTAERDLFFEDYRKQHHGVDQTIVRLNRRSDSYLDWARRNGVVHEQDSIESGQSVFEGEERVVVQVVHVVPKEQRKGVIRFFHRDQDTRSIAWIDKEKDRLRFWPDRDIYVRERNEFVSVQDRLELEAQAAQDDSGAQARLKAIDEEWAMAKDEDRVVFFAIDYLRADEQAREALFIQYARKNGETFPYMTLSGLEYRFFSLVRYKFPEEAKGLIEPTFENARAKIAVLEEANPQRSFEDLSPEGRRTPPRDFYWDRSTPSSDFQRRHSRGKGGSFEKNSSGGEEVQRRITEVPHRVEHRPGIGFKPFDWAYVVALGEKGSVVTVGFREWTEAMKRIPGGVSSQHDLQTWNEFCRITNKWGKERCPDVKATERPGEYTVQIDPTLIMSIRVSNKIMTFLGLEKQKDTAYSNYYQD